jgi:hypothetical protein
MAFIGRVNLTHYAQHQGQHELESAALLGAPLQHVAAYVQYTVACVVISNRRERSGLPYSPTRLRWPPKFAASGFGDRVCTASGLSNH